MSSNSNRQRVIDDILRRDADSIPAAYNDG